MVLWLFCIFHKELSERIVNLNEVMKSQYIKLIINTEIKCEHVKVFEKGYVLIFLIISHQKIICKLMRYHQ